MEQQFDIQEDQQQINLQDYFRIIYRGRWIILASFLSVFLITTYFTFTTKPVYEASSKIMIESQGSTERALFDVNYFGNQSTLITNQVEILTSRMLAEKVVRYLEGAPYRDSLAIFQSNDDGEYVSFRNQVKWIMERLEVSPIKDTDVITINFSAGSPFEAAQICNTVIQIFQESNRGFNRSQFKELRQFLEKQLQKKGDELQRSEDALKEYQENQKLVALDERTSELIIRYAETQAQLEATLVELEASLEQKKNLEKQLEDRRSTFSTEVTQISSPLILQLQTEYAKLVSEKVTYETLISQDRIDPQEYRSQLRSMESRIQAIKEKLEDEARRIASTSMVSDPLLIAQNIIGSIIDLETAIKGTRAKTGVLRDILSQYDAELELLPSQGLELARLKRQQLVDQETFLLMTEKLEETKISEAGQKDNIRLVDAAIEPSRPTKPNKKLNLILGALIGLGLGVGLTFLLEYFDDSIKNPEELENEGFPILSIIPQIQTDEISKKIFSQNGDKNGDVEEIQKIESRLVTHFDPKSPISEAYRTLRTNIQFKNLEKNDKAILITSSTPKEGKSTTVANLAITMAQMGTKVLLVDTDLRRPVIHSIFDLKKDRGITNYLMRKFTLDEIAKSTIIENLYVITSGPLPPNPSEILSSDVMKEFVAEAREKYDLVLFDSPPVIAVTDAAILSTMVDGLILVVKAHQTRRDAIKRARNLLEGVKSNVYGSLLNGVNIERTYGAYYHYYYYHYYNYYGHDLKRRVK